MRQVEVCVKSYSGRAWVQSVLLRSQLVASYEYVAICSDDRQQESTI